MANMIQKAGANMANRQQGNTTTDVNTIMNSVLDSNGMRKRFQEILGARTPQFLSSIVSIVNGDDGLKKAMIEAPMTVIQSALKAAMFDLPIDPGLGHAYIVAFKDGKDGGKHKATFIPGYKGLVQLCLRTGQYARVPKAMDVREGELLSYDPLTGDAEFSWIQDENERNNLPIIGYAGYFRLKNGAECTIYMSRAAVEAHEKKNRKGQYMGKGWRDDFDAMARKTVIRKLCNFAPMSITYQDAGDKLAQAIALEPDAPDQIQDPSQNVVDAVPDDAPASVEPVDPDTGELLPFGDA